MSRFIKRMTNSISLLNEDLLEGKEVTILTINNIKIRNVIRFLKICIHADVKQGQAFELMLDAYEKQEVNK